MYLLSSSNTCKFLYLIKDHSSHILYGVTRVLVPNRTGKYDLLWQIVSSYNEYSDNTSAYKHILQIAHNS